MSGVKGKSGVYKRTTKNKESLSDARKKGLSNGTVAIWNKGKRYSLNLTDGQRKQLSERAIGNKSTKGKIGKNANNWQGGITPENKKERSSIKYRLWREKVFKRDNWTCQNCGVSGCYLEAHHIKSWAKYPKLRYVLSNGQTLCLECHKLTDNYKGKNNK